MTTSFRLLLLAYLASLHRCYVSGHNDWHAPWNESAFDPAVQWPAGGLNCPHGFRDFDPLTQKRVYHIGVHAPAGIDTAWREFNLTFEAYLDATVGQRWKPPIQFKMKPTVDPLRDWVDNKEDVDFMYSDTGLYSCIGVEIGGQPLGTTISHLTARGKAFNLDVYGGSIVVLAENREINSIEDLKDKVIGAQAISDFSGAQVQFYVMLKNGMDYITDPKQVIFTENQEDIVNGVLDGRWDVGFVRTGQIERTQNAKGEFLNSDLFKVIEPRIYVMDTGDLFPFLHSTPVFPEWPLFAKQNVDRMVSEEVALALINFEYHKIVGDLIHQCHHELEEERLEELLEEMHGNITMGHNNLTDLTLQLNHPPHEPTICDTAPPVYFDPTARCDTTRELAELAYHAGTAGRHNGFRPARSHFELRTMQQTAGFLRQKENGDWHCSRADTLYDGITCPVGQYKVPKKIFDGQCAEIGLPCPDNYKCYCKPCIKAFEVDVLQWNAVEENNDNNTTAAWENSTTLLQQQQQQENHALLRNHQGGCTKMSLCGAVEQTREVLFRAYDNREREDAEVTVMMHVGQESKPLEVRHVPNNEFAYEFGFSHNQLGVGVLEVYLDGIQIPESPFRVEVIPRDCDVDFPGQGKAPTAFGECECGSGTIEIGGDCMPMGIFAGIVASAAFVLVVEIAYCYLRYKRAKSDEMWQVVTEELHFSQPVEVIGQGSFGVVLLAEYRGTKVAIKRVLPLKDKRSSAGGSRAGGGRSRSGSTSGDHMDLESQDNNTPPPPTSIVSKGTASFDGSKGGGSQICSTTGDGEADSDLDFLGELSFGRPKSKWAKWFPWLFPDKEGRYNASILGTASGGTKGTSRALVAWLCPCLDENARRQQEFVIEMRLLSRLRHPCITTVMGAVMTRGCEPMMVMEYMEHGSLFDLLRNETMYTGGEIILQIVRDVAQGLRFLHASKPPILHGDLKAKNILIDSRFRAKVADFGLATAKTSKSSLAGTPFWMAPEYLRGKTEYNTCCDIYAFGIIMYEIYSRKSPYEGEHPRKVLRKVCDPRINKRPPVPGACPPKMIEIMEKCWSPDPFFRPQAKDLDTIFLDMGTHDAEPVIEQSPTIRVRTEVATGDMLYQVFPRKVADKLKAGQKVEAETHENVTVFFSDIVHFTDHSRIMSAGKVCHMLDRLYQAFDALANKHEVFKVETIGDAWMGVTNLENNQDDSHVKRIAEFAVDAIEAAGKIMIDEEDPKKGFVKIRVGFHSGQVVSNVIGSLNPRYGLFGDTVNTASRMESNSYSGKIHCSEDSAKLLKEQAPNMPLTRRGKIAVKGKGNMTTYWVGEGLLREEPNGAISRTMDDDHPTVRFTDSTSFEKKLSEVDE